MSPRSADTAAGRPARVPGGTAWGAAAAILIIAVLLVIGVVRTIGADLDLAEVQNTPTLPISAAVSLLERSEGWRPDLVASAILLAGQLRDVDPHAARVQALTALRLDPRNEEAWALLAQIDLQLNDIPAALTDVRNGARYNHTFAAHNQAAILALAVNEPALFWSELQAALRVAPPPTIATVVREAVEMAGGNAARLESFLPTDAVRPTETAFHYLLQQGQLAVAVEAWPRTHCGPADIGYCSNSAIEISEVGLDAAYAGSAAAMAMVPDLQCIWNEAIAQYQLRAAKSVVGAIADGQFAQPWYQGGFGWQSTGAVPLAVVGQGPPGVGAAVRLNFDGNQRDGANIFFQWVPVVPGQAYRVSYQDRRLGGGNETGLELVVTASAGKPLQEIPAALSAQWHSDSGDLIVPAHVQSVRFTFLYRRPLGQTPLSDAVLIAHVRLSPIH